jgi:cytochrome c551/c552
MKLFNNSRRLKALIYLILTVFSASNLFAANAEKGRILYESNNCGSCHAIDKKLIGPALMGVHERHSEQWLVQWIRNYKKLRDAGDVEALKLYAENNSSPMNVYENLSVDDVKDILEYIKSQSTVKPIAEDKKNVSEAEDNQSLTYLTFLVIVFFILFLVLTRVRSRLRKIAPKDDA